MRSYAILLIVGLSIAAEGPQEDRAKRDFKRLQGTWQATSLEEDGKKATDTVVKQIKLVFKGEQLTFFAGETVLMQGTVKLDPSAKPKELDLASTAGRLKGRKVHCVYDLNGDALRICLGSPGGPRPTELKSGKDQPLVACKRKKR